MFSILSLWYNKNENIIIWGEIIYKKDISNIKLDFNIIEKIKKHILNKKILHTTHYLSDCDGIASVYWVKVYLVVIIIYHIQS